MVTDNVLCNSLKFDILIKITFFCNIRKEIIDQPLVKIF